MPLSPSSITADKEAGQFQLVWSDGREQAISFWELRCACPCAMCVSELTGRRLLDPAQIDRAIHPLQVELSGNYALKIYWSDGHSTGLYTWSRLQELAADKERE